MDQPQLVDPHTEIRQEVAKLCAKFPGEYWRKLDADLGRDAEYIATHTKNCPLPKGCDQPIEKNQGCMVSRPPV